jgi:hypothetical protein
MADSVKRMLSFTPPERIEAAIQKQALGQVVWWDCCFGSMQVPRLAKDGSTVLYNQPALQLIMGMRGYALGPENNVWFVATIDPMPTDEILERAVKAAMENLLQQKAAQLSLPGEPT